MLKIIKKRINNNEIKYRFIKSSGDNLTYAEFLNLLTSRDNDFLKMFRSELNRASSELIEPDIASYLWECVPVSRSTINKPFEFVAINSPALKSIREQNYSSFQEHFNRSRDDDVVSFPNLSGDSIMIVPIPRVGYQYNCSGRDNEIRDYKDFAAFNDNAQTCQWNSFWQEVGVKMNEALNSSSRTKWLSTHGLGVSYLHVRIDSRPKYYQNQEYLREDVNQNVLWDVPVVDLSNLKRQAISEITGELAKNPLISTNELDSNLHQWKDVIENQITSEGGLNGFKQRVLIDIQRVREEKVAQIEQPPKYPFRRY